MNDKPLKVRELSRGLYGERRFKLMEPFVVTSDSDGTATAAANGDLPVTQDCQARAVRHRQNPPRQPKKDRDNALPLRHLHD